MVNNNGGGATRPHKQKENKMRNTDCILTDESNPNDCKNETKYIVDVQQTSKDGTWYMPMKDFECCEMHYQMSKDCDTLTLKNVKRK